MKSQAPLPQNTQPKSAIIDSLRKDFAAFRGQHDNIRRIPRKLRQAVFTALEAGIRPCEIKSACGVTASQIAQWRSKDARKRKDVRRAAQPKNAVEDVRVIQVMEDPDPGKSQNQEIQFEMRVGQWFIKIHQAL